MQPHKFEQDKVNTLLAHMDTALHLPGHRKCLESALQLPDAGYFLQELKVSELKMTHRR